MTQGAGAPPTCAGTSRLARAALPLCAAAGALPLLGGVCLAWLVVVVAGGRRGKRRD